MPSMPFQHNELWQFRSIGFHADRILIGHFASATVSVPISDSIFDVRPEIVAGRHWQQESTSFYPYDPLTDKGSRGMFQGSILDNRIKQHLRFGVRARNGGPIEDVPEMAVTSLLQIAE